MIVYDAVKPFWCEQQNVLDCTHLEKSHQGR